MNTVRGPPWIPYVALRGSYIHPTVGDPSRCKYGVTVAGSVGPVGLAGPVTDSQRTYAVAYSDGRLCEEPIGPTMEPWPTRAVASAGDPSVPLRGPWLDARGPDGPRVALGCPPLAAA